MTENLIKPVVVASQKKEIPK